MANGLRPYNAWVAQKFRNLSPTPSTLNRRVELWKKVAVENEIGQTAYTDTLVRTVWAQILSQAGSMVWQQTETVLTDVTDQINMRYKSAIDIAVGDYLRYEGKRYDIRYILNPYESNWMISLFCLEVQDT
jgi:SPP1 family predicted phage head-tail adaptor